jgi:hypothetical protein
MVILVDRFISDNDSTISRVMVDGNFVCFGLEDEYREEKMSEETRIPAGTYKVSLRTAGSHHTKYSSRFSDIHKGMLHIRNVPNFKWILIHCGNTDEDTAGCLLVGSQAITEPGDMKIISSTAAYRRFYPMVVDAAANNTLSITFLDNDRAQITDVANSNDDMSIELPSSGKKLSKKEKKELFMWNAEQRNEMEIGAGSLVGALIDELVKNAETYIRVENPEPDGYTCDYTLVQGRQDIIAPIGIALGFKKVTDNKLEVHNA